MSPRLALVKEAGCVDEKMGNEWSGRKLDLAKIVFLLDLHRIFQPYQ
jgi:hypothetical protein